MKVTLHNFKWWGCKLSGCFQKILLHSIDVWTWFLCNSSKLKYDHIEKHWRVRLTASWSFSDVGIYASLLHYVVLLWWMLRCWISAQHDYRFISVMLGLGWSVSGLWVMSLRHFVVPCVLKWMAEVFTHHHSNQHWYGLFEGTTKWER